MSRIQNVKDILGAIESVKTRVRAAMKLGQRLEAERLMGDLYGLEACLVTETTEMLKEEEYVKRAA